MTEDTAPYVTGREVARPDGWYWYRHLPGVVYVEGENVWMAGRAEPLPLKGCTGMWGPRLESPPEMTEGAPLLRGLTRGTTCTIAGHNAVPLTAKDGTTVGAWCPDCHAEVRS